MWKVDEIPAGSIINLHYNFVVAKPLVRISQLLIVILIISDILIRKIHNFAFLRSLNAVIRTLKSLKL